MNQRMKSLMNSKSARWGILILVGFVLSVNYYFYDAFSTLKDLLRAEFDISNTQYGLFVSFYSIPNTFLFMAVIGGVILDRLGIRRTGFIFVFFMTFGAVLTAYGSSKGYQNGGLGYNMMSSFLPKYSPELKMMLLGRFFYGLGAETSIVVISKILVKWFKGKDLALAFGLKVGFGRLGTFAALQLSPRLAQNGIKLDWAIWFAAILVCIGLLVFVIYMLIDIKVDKQLEQKELLTKEDKFKMKDILDIIKNPAYIMIALICLTFYSAVFPFMAFAPDFFYHKFGVSYVQSGQITSLLPLGTLFFTPLFGFLIDRFGKAASAMIFGSFALFIVHITFSFTNTPPQALMILLGVAFSLVPAAMWPSMVRLVKEKQIGTAYGLMYSIQNLGLWGFPILAGIILDKANPGNPETLNYTPTMIMFAALGLLGLFFALLLKYYDKKRGFGVDLPLNK
ncbi:MAG: MFS transporter [Bacteroidetes bacterium]|jgi:MFS family permease|nr:MFS transporter [Bacteroidota bacterium]MBT3421600.1 MFS transporter [Bacteroidota bacterium]MBT3799811.1 MFS transporter [Bacteroidota bacterium]MBT4730095.1 MFS transporter [Bacteroidota bacterium]MBT4969642.1 MFS transporter [Bacteroidota bacterium]